MVLTSYAVISVTNQGSILAEKIAAGLPGEVKLYAREGRNLSKETENYLDLGHLVESLFPQVDGMIFIMAAGIVVRVIAPLLVHKAQDPAVVVTDEQGEYAISLVSGRIGGGIELAKKVASAMGGTPVITAGSDTQQIATPDLLAISMGLEVESFETAKTVSELLSDGKNVHYFLDATIPEAEMYQKKAREFLINLLPMSEMNNVPGLDGAIVITDHQIVESVPTLYLRPPALIAGIGCRRGTRGADILQALHKVVAAQGRSLRSLKGLASVSVKEDEIGILAVGQQLGLPMEFLPIEKLREVVAKRGLEESDFVKAKIGVGNVCEAAAIAASQFGELIVSKKQFDGITIALARIKSE
jgi:Cobalamin biosynthesis protein CbiG